MTWFKLDDQFHSQEKVLAAGNAAVGLYCRLGTYCADKLTDGFVADSVARSMGTRKELQALLECPIPDTRPLLSKVDGGFLIRDYLEYNPSREKVLADREAAKLRMQGHRRSGEHRTNNSSDNERSSHPPVPVPDGATTDIEPSSPVPIREAPRQAGEFSAKATAVATLYADEAVKASTGYTGKPKPRYHARAMETAFAHPDLERWVTERPTASITQIVAWLNGDTHSMIYCPQVEAS